MGLIGRISVLISRRIGLLGKFIGWFWGRCSLGLIRRIIGFIRKMMGMLRKLFGWFW